MSSTTMAASADTNMSTSSKSSPPEANLKTNVPSDQSKSAQENQSNKKNLWTFSRLNIEIILPLLCFAYLCARGDAPIDRVLGRVPYIMGQFLALVAEVYISVFAFSAAFDFFMTTTGYLFGYLTLIPGVGGVVGRTKGKVDAIFKTNIPTWCVFGLVCMAVWSGL
ncbi:hypothetical protein TWF696_009285 [Orbilia brochopaga]|uniref:Uncharacterized protein n=1 Tax=Orbilia brochopaga TaxID=3140254 RepID=A0AAV9UI91_9PEZI